MSLEQSPESPLDPSQIVAYRRWSDSAVDNDLRLAPLAEGSDPSASLWTSGLMSASPASLENSRGEPEPVRHAEFPSGEELPEPRPEASWLAGLVREEPKPRTRSWLAGLVKEEPSPLESAPSPSSDEPEPTAAANAPYDKVASGLAELSTTTPARRTWEMGLDEAPAASQPSTPTTSWLSGLVKEEKRPALNDIARLILGKNAPSPIAPESPAKPPVLTPPAALSPPPAVSPWPASSPPAPAPTPRLGPVSPGASSVEEVERVRLPRGLEALPSPPPSASVSKSSAVPLPTAPPKPSEPSQPAQPAAAPPPSALSPVVKRESGAPPPAKAAPAEVKTQLEKIPARDKASFFRALAAMFEAGVPLFAIFEFLSREGESPAVAAASRRIGQNLVAGWPLSASAAQEPKLFDIKSVRMLEVGYRSGQLGQILAQLAEDEEHVWKMKQNLKSQLTYPFGIALMTVVAVVVLPPLVLTDLLLQVVSLTEQPPLLTRWLLSFSAFIGSPWTWLAGAVVGACVGYGLRTARGRELLDNLELAVWFVPALGPLWRNVVGLRFIRVFAMTYKAGLPAVLGMELAAAATGSQLAYRVYPLMKRTLVDGGSLAESFAAGGFLPTLALEAVSAGELAGKVPVMLHSAAEILQAEVQSRIDAVAKLVEPIVLACLGVFVGVFVLGCLLPIVELTAAL